MAQYIEKKRQVVSQEAHLKTMIKNIPSRFWKESGIATTEDNC
jgi:hypothetical protein